MRKHPERNPLETIAAQADRALDERRVELEADLALLERRVKEQVDEIERRRIEASKAEAAAVYEAGRYQADQARNYARDGVELTIDTITRHSREFDGPA